MIRVRYKNSNILYYLVGFQSHGAALLDSDGRLVVGPLDDLVAAEGQLEVLRENERRKKGDETWA